ncbi:leucine-rich repeat-containing protein 15 [Phlebotomus argentipes]|uniref:leucine-rich repeat-containing protein 15 n=1 Tax=Phlebotomus argentipes TaxID=94469 RepID=UPI00289339B2|nr:leucine-rich repeat-containing protein 15 [Phlebotomus argentipes]XP_059619769.1 leucine-rich repeat-containing protein 15 [Phlebotomus argentipes]XP_059619770.1 leucine-rich repeat-containing protein 15 [Phlebotomus argentipes]
MRWKLLLTLVLLNVSSVWSGGCGSVFKGKCSCGYGNYDNSRRYIVNCTNTGFRDTAVLENLPPETEVVIFTGNRIPELPWNVFGQMNDLESLTIVDMSNNGIQEIRGKSYHHVSNVRRLILNHNNLSISRDDDDFNHHHPRVFSNFVNLTELHLTNAFADNTSDQLSEDLHDIFVNSNLTKLIKLHLEQNEISSFRDKRVFCDLPALRDLHLGDNSLKELNFNVMCLKHLRFLDLERNKFEMVKPRDLATLDALQALPGREVNLVVDFMYNPFHCDCSISYLNEWLLQTKVDARNRDYYTCRRNGKDFDTEVILSLKIQRCKNQSQSTRTTSGHTATLVFLLVVLCFILVGLVAALIYVSRDRINLRRTLTPMLSNVSKKVQYTSIKDEDCPEVHV